jgi:lipoyl(octanoyl) transferase
MLRPALTTGHHSSRQAAVLDAHFLGPLDFARSLALQQRLVFEAGGSVERRISVLLCEHPPLVTVGRQGSREHVLFTQEELLSHRLEVRWVGRGGGCVLHAPGQLAVYPIVPLELCGWSVGEFLTRFQTGLMAALGDLRVALDTRARRSGIWGRSGQIVTIGAAVKSWISYHGAFINVAPRMDLVRRIIADPIDRAPASSLSVERQKPVRMTDVRTRLIPSLASAFDCDRFQIYTGHPLMQQPLAAQGGSRRVG